MVKTELLTGIVQTIWGRALTAGLPLEWGELLDDERAAILLRYDREIDADVAALQMLMDEVHRLGLSEAFLLFRRAEGLDRWAVEEIIEAASVATESPDC